MPLTFDTYSRCSYGCKYCFALFQKALARCSGKRGQRGRDSYSQPLKAVDAKATIRLFDGSLPDHQLAPYIGQRFAMQWGAMADPFDEHERKHGVGLELLRFFRSIEYPICFSTKGTWWTEDERYAEIFRGAKHFNVKISIITLDEAKAKAIEKGCPAPAERLAAIERIAGWNGGGATLRLRPFIIGVSNPSHRELIREAARCGATAVSTEFMCMETRSTAAADGYRIIGEQAGLDLPAFYRKHTPGASGYLRLNREVKRPFVDEMEEECGQTGLRFYVSDAHFKERCANGSCCGLPPSWNYQRGQFTEAVIIARKQGRVTWSEAAPRGLFDFKWVDAYGFNTKGPEDRAKFNTMTMADYMRWQWNNVNGAKSPYKYFGGVLVPDGRDEHGDVIYRYAGD